MLVVSAQLTWLTLISLLQEFEVIAQIKLLQSACNSYCLSADSAFLRWFKSQPQHSEEERYKHHQSFTLYITTTSALAILSFWLILRLSGLVAVMSWFFSVSLAAMLCLVTLKEWETVVQPYPNFARAWLRDSACKYTLEEFKNEAYCTLHLDLQEIYPEI